MFNVLFVQNEVFVEFKMGWNALEDGGVEEIHGCGVNERKGDDV